MQQSYNRIAGQSLERIAALSDGVFAVAMTLIVLEIRVPDRAIVHTEPDLAAALGALAPQVVTYLLSFLTLGIFWLGQQTQLSRMRHSDRNFAWIHFVFLSVVAVLPFSTSLLARFITLRLALLVYWVNIFLLGATLYVSWRYAAAADLVNEETSSAMSRAIARRIVIAQGLYAFGALLCVWNTYASIGFIVTVQLYYMLAPRFGPLARIEH